MNKTVTINISGIIFHIEEDAYENLGAYLKAIRSYFSATDGGSEIMGDIESRIAELLQERLSASKQAILLADVIYVKGVMGRPEDFSDEQGREEGAAPESETTQPQKIRKRLYRNPEEKVLGGVCGGLAAYFDIDTVWVRLAMFLLIFFGGVSIWLYIILWIIIPEAKTTAEKFAMRGETANINNIFRSFKEEAEDVKNRFDKYGNDLSRNYGESVRSNISSSLAAIFSIIGRLIGLLFVIIGATLLLAWVASLLGLTVAGTNSDVRTWISALFGSGGNYAMVVLSFMLVFGIPVLMLLYAGIKMLFRIRYSNRWLNLGMGMLWFTGLVMSVYVTVVTLQQFTEHTALRETVAVQETRDTLVIRMNPATEVLKAYEFENIDDLEENLEGYNHNYRFGRAGNKVNVLGFAQLDVVESAGDSAELVITYSSKGASKQEANLNAKAIKYTVRQENNELVFDQIFLVEEGVKWRLPELKMKLMLPLGKVVKFDKSVKYLLDDVANTTNTWDGDMAGRRWEMTAKGLTCIDCQGLTGDDNYHDGDIPPKYRHRKHVHINKKGIHVNGDDTEIKIDKNGIRIKTPEEEVELK